METKQKTPTNIDDYIAQFPKDVQAVLEQVRMTIRKAAPEAEEAIGYQMPAFKFKGNLVYFAAFKEHIGFYPIPTGIEKFKQELAPYVQGKGSVQFPLNKPMPLGLIRKIVAFRVKENLAKAAAKGETKKLRPKRPPRA
jgi:uncharacterized protein YdhG (YjbR/CyaY superfamily)